MSVRTASDQRTLRVDYLARVEGEGAMYVKISGDEVEDVKLRIYEPPRFFEAFLRGRAYTEVPDITSRICGICPIAYQTSGIRAIEDACGVAIDEGPLRDLRRLIYHGEWIESHGLHIYALHAPDFLGFESVIELAAAHPDVAAMGLELKKTGNRIVGLIGGREIHPINIKVGGFYRTPTKKELLTLRDPLQKALEQSLATVRFVATLPMPEVQRDVELVCLSDGDLYPIDRGKIVSSKGLDIAPGEFARHIVEEHVQHSNALHARVRERGTYLTGPIARFNLAYEQLRPVAKEAAVEAGLQAGNCQNPFQSIIIRAVELVHACDEALSILDRYQQPDRPAIDVPPRRGVGHGVSEAPRGMLYHRYELDDDGTILDARIVPPTSQNQLAIEADLRAVVDRYHDLDDDALRHRCEQAIRNHDPCISCATHFLELTVERGPS
ncbi:MAG: Ni/Fe hydrogenase subunit alpha [Solirubrobacteraceae bacterium]